MGTGEVELQANPRLEWTARKRCLRVPSRLRRLAATQAGAREGGQQGPVARGLPGGRPQSQLRDLHDEGYKGLYNGLGRDEIKRKKNVPPKDDLLDVMGATELAANDFRITQAADKMRREQVKGAKQAFTVHRDVGKEVAFVMLQAICLILTQRRIPDASRTTLRRSVLARPVPSEMHRQCETSVAILADKSTVSSRRFGLSW